MYPESFGSCMVDSKACRIIPVQEDRRDTSIYQGRGVKTLESDQLGRSPRLETFVHSGPNEMPTTQ